MKKVAAVVALSLLTASVAFAQPSGERRAAMQEKATEAKATAQQKQETWSNMSQGEQMKTRAEYRKKAHQKKEEVQSGN